MNTTMNLGDLVFSKGVVPNALIKRPQPKFVFCDSNEDDGDPSVFTAKPAEDIPRNRLTEKLKKGIQSYV